MVLRFLWITAVFTDGKAVQCNPLFPNNNRFEHPRQGSTLAVDFYRTKLKPTPRCHQRNTRSISPNVKAGGGVV